MAALQHSVRGVARSVINRKAERASPFSSSATILLTDFSMQQQMPRSFSLCSNSPRWRIQREITETLTILSKARALVSVSTFKTHQPGQNSHTRVVFVKFLALVSRISTMGTHKDIEYARGYDAIHPHFQCF